MEEIVSCLIELVNLDSELYAIKTFQGSLNITTPLSTSYIEKFNRKSASTTDRIAEVPIIMEILPPPSVPPLPNTPIYDMIRMVGRKNWHVVRKYIEHYTKEGEIVLDPFAGSGVAIIEALLIGRKAIYNDLNSYLCFVARTTCTPVSIKDLEKAFNIVEQEVRRKDIQVVMRDGTRKTIKYAWLYETRCPNCKSACEILDTEFAAYYKVVSGEVPIRGEGKLEKAALNLYRKLEDREQVSILDIRQEIDISELDLKRSEELTRTINMMLEKGMLLYIGEKPINIRFICPNGCTGKRGSWKPPDSFDIQKIELIKQMSPISYYPQLPLKYPNRKYFLTYRPGVERVDLLFTKRNLIALSALLETIETIRLNENIRDHLKLAFAAILYACSKMCRKGAGSWGEKNYVIRPNFLEKNVLYVFRNRGKTIIEGKREALKIKIWRESKDPKDVINGRANVCFLNVDARHLPLPDDSIDYIFTDPEYGPSIQYFELTFMPSSWLKIFNDWEKEIVVNPRQNKDVAKYRDMLVDAFMECFRVLKPGRYMTVTFHSREIKYWNSLLYAISIAGFKYVDAVYQPPPKEYTDWLYARNPGKMSGDIYITFMKPEEGS